MHSSAEGSSSHSSSIGSLYPSDTVAFVFGSYVLLAALVDDSEDEVATSVEPSPLSSKTLSMVSTMVCVCD